MTLTASGLAKAYGARRLFDGVTMNLSPGRRVALVGGNGAGKTTLLEIMAGLIEPDAGSVTKPRDAQVGYLPQDLSEISEGSARQHVMAGAGPVAELAQTLKDLEDRLVTPTAGQPGTGQPKADQSGIGPHEGTGQPGSGQDDLVARYGEAQARFEQLGGYALEARVAKVLAGRASELNSASVAVALAFLLRFALM